MSDRTQALRSLPAAEDAERALIGSILVGGADVLEEAQAIFCEEHFSVPAMRTCWEMLVKLHAARCPVDFITLSNTLRDFELLETVGGPAAVSELFMMMPTAANFRSYAEIVREKYVRRQMIALGAKFTAKAFDEAGEKVESLLEEFQAEAIEIGALSSDTQSLRRFSKEEVLETLAGVEARYHRRGSLAGLPTGFTDLDRTLDGLRPKFVYVFAGRPAMGKSSIGVNIAEHVALHLIEQGEGVAFFALEMTRQQVLQRLIFEQAKISLQRVRDGFLAEKDFPILQAVATQVIKSHIYLDDTSGLTIAQFRSRARRAVIRHKCRLIVLDYVQLMKGSSKRARENRNLELAEIMDGIRETAKDLNIPIIVLAQLNRGAEERSESRPTMADLKESGAIEENAHVVGLLYRPVYYAKTEEKKSKLAEKLKMSVEDLEQYAEVIIDKNREGGVGAVKLKFVPEYTKFENLDPERRLYSNDPKRRQELEEDEE